MVKFTDISHIALEVTDLEEAWRFYDDVLGMESVHRDEGELGQGRIVLRNGSSHFLLLEKVAGARAAVAFLWPGQKQSSRP